MEISGWEKEPSTKHFFLLTDFPGDCLRWRDPMEPYKMHTMPML